MFTSNRDFQLDLVNHFICDAWQYVVNTRKTLDTAEFCFESIADMLSHMGTITQDWQNSMFEKAFAQRGTAVAGGFPDYKISVGSIETTCSFLVEKHIKDFFQYIRNAFDGMAQIANSGLLANKSKAVDTVDFPKMLGVFEQSTYSTAFPLTSAWFDKVNLDDEFVYIDAINNRTKHTYDVKAKLAMGIFGSANTAEISTFYRKMKQHDKQDIGVYLQALLTYTENKFEEFLDAFCKEYPNQTFCQNRYHTAKVYQQKMNGNASNNFSIVYLEGGIDFSLWPDQIFLLFAKDDGDEVISTNCSAKTILVKDLRGSDFFSRFIGRYKASDDIGIDYLNKYRKYQKDSANGLQCLADEMSKPESEIVYYRANPYIDIETVTDDTDFAERIQLPF